MIIKLNNPKLKKISSSASSKPKPIESIPKTKPASKINGNNLIPITQLSEKYRCKK